MVGMSKNVSSSSSASSITSSDNDSEKETVQEAAIRLLFWRLPPEESHSDWTIEVIVNDNHDDDIFSDSHESAITTYNQPGCSQMRYDFTRKNEPSFSSKTDYASNISHCNCHIYHVHKCILAAGPRKCGYFSRLFSNPFFFESSEQKSSIQLPALAAASFPFFLDYMYLSTDLTSFTLELPTTQNATALLFLSEYFDNKSLRKQMKHFWKQDLYLSNCYIYYQHALAFHNEKIMRAVLSCCIQNFYQIHATSAVLQVSDVEFWIYLFDSVEPSREASFHASYLVTHFCHCHKKSMTWSSFTRLTDDQYMPYISEEVATDILDLHEYFYLKHHESHLHQDGKLERVGNSICNVNVDTSVSKENVLLSSLQLRCISALTKNWYDIAVDRNGLVEPRLQRQNALVLVDLLAKALYCAHVKIDKYKVHLWQVSNSLREHESQLI